MHRTIYKEVDVNTVMDLIGTTLKDYSSPQALAILGITTASYFATAKTLATRDEALEDFISTLRKVVKTMGLQSEEKQHGYH